MLIEASSQEACPNCGSWQAINFNFCGQCGQRNPSLLKKAVKNDQKYRRHLRYLSVYAILSIVLLLVAAFTEDSLKILIIWTVTFAIIDLLFAYLQPAVWTLFFSRKIELKPLILIVVIGVVTGFLVFLSMGSLNLMLFEESYTSLPLFEDTDNPLLLHLLIIAVCPAIF